MTDAPEPEQLFSVYALAAGGWPRKRLEPIRSTPARAREDAELFYRQSRLTVVPEGSSEDHALARMVGLARSWRRDGLVVGEG